MGTIGSKIYQLRKKQGLSQEELGFKLNVSRQTISKWETDQMRPNLENLKSLCTVFDVGVDYFTSDLDDVSSNKITAAAVESNDAIINKDGNTAKQKKINRHFVAIAVVSLIVVILIISTVILDKLSTALNQGYDRQSNLDVNRGYFVLSLILLILFSVMDFFLIFTCFRRRRK